jgi:signal transduction histidine kinase
VEHKTGIILVVDDDPLNQKLLARRLEKEGHFVATADSGERALEMLRSGAFDAVLLDLVMPGMDGSQVLGAIKSDPALRTIPVIMVSAETELDSVVRCIAMGAEDYLPKPFEPVLLHARLTASLEKKQLRDLELAYLQQEMLLRESEKLATVGRLSAGMAHELNNPASAIRRGAAELLNVVEGLKAAQVELAAAGLAAEGAELLRSQDAALRSREAGELAGDALARSDREAELEERLVAAGLADAWEIAPTLASRGYGPGDLGALVERLPARQLGPALAWLAASLTAHGLTEELGLAAGRVSGIVDALKAYSYMDQAPVQQVDLHAALDTTVDLLRPRLGEGIEIACEYAPDLPRVEAYGSELNQVWTHLIDNAAYAMGGQGRIILRTRRDGTGVVVEVEDDGPGIPQADQPRIFEPFFTTRPVGEGKGLGLTISRAIVTQRHHGRISVESQPGRTQVQVWLPVARDEAGDPGVD